MTLALLKTRSSIVLYFRYQAIAGIFLIAGVLRASAPVFGLGLAVKLGLFPFHLWVVPVLTASPTWLLFTLLVPLKLPIYLLRSGLEIVCLPSLVVGALLATGESAPVAVVAARRIMARGLIVVAKGHALFSLFFGAYAATLAAFLDSRTRFIGVLGLIGIPPLPLF